MGGKRTTAVSPPAPAKGVPSPWRSPNPLRFSVGFGSLGDIQHSNTLEKALS